MAKIGFIGLGVMGAPMALNLQNGGHQLFVHTRTRRMDQISMARMPRQASHRER